MSAGAQIAMALAMTLGLTAASYLGALAVVSHIDGWRKLVEHFPLRPGHVAPPHVRAHVSARILGAKWWQQAKFDWSMQTAETDAGLYVAPHWWIAFCHPPVCIPWEAIRSARPGALHPNTQKKGEHIELTFVDPALDRRLVLDAAAVTRPLPAPAGEDSAVA